MSANIKYPDVEVPLIGEDGNIGAIMARVSRALKREGIGEDEINTFRREVMASASYDAALRVVMGWVSVS